LAFENFCPGVSALNFQMPPCSSKLRTGIDTLRPFWRSGSAHAFDGSPTLT
jgi:hypothetical protein